MMTTKYNITVYPTTQIIMGEKTVDQYIEEMADLLYDEWVCDRRFLPADLLELVKIGIRRRENTRI